MIGFRLVKAVFLELNLRDLAHVSMYLIVFLSASVDVKGTRIVLSSGRLTRRYFWISDGSKGEGLMPYGCLLAIAYRVYCSHHEVCARFTTTVLRVFLRTFLKRRCPSMLKIWRNE